MPVTDIRKQKTQQELEIERIQSLTTSQVSDEDVAKLRTIRICRDNVVTITKEFEAVKERKKLAEEALELAVRDASTYHQNRQLALEFGAAV